MPSIAAAVCPFRLPRWLLGVGFVLVALGAAMDYAIPSVSVKAFPVADVHLWICVGLLAVMAAADREGSWRRRAVWFAGLALLGLGLMYGLHDLADRVKRREVIALLGGNAGLWLWLAMLWMGIPLLWRRPGRSRALSWAAGALMVYVTFCFISAAASYRPPISIWRCGYERCLMGAVAVAWLRASEHDPRLRRAVAIVVIVWMGLLMAGGTGISLADWAGGKPFKKQMVAKGFMYQRGTDADGSLPERRLLFPMLHFNRTAYFALVACMGALVAGVHGWQRRGGKKRRLRRWAQAAALALMGAASLWVILASHTRAILLAAVAGLVIWSSLVSRRVMAAVLAGAVLLVIFMPARHRDHLLYVLTPSNYFNHTGPLNTMEARLHAWGYGLQVIRENPLTGLGYGTPVVRSFYERYIRRYGSPALKENLEGGHVMQHTHNVWLETAAESGLPAALALLVFCAVRWGLLWKAWRLHRRTGHVRVRAAAWVALEAALFLAGLIFFMIKHNSGLLTFFVWVLTLQAALDLTRRGQETAPKNHA